MSRQPDLSVAEIEALLFAGLLASNDKTKELTRYIFQVTSGEVIKEDTELIDIQNNFHQQLCKLLAIRLKENDESTPLITAQDFLDISPAAIQAIAKVRNEVFDEKELAQITDMLRAMFEYFFEDIIMLQQVGLNQYQGQWRIFDIAFDIATERQMATTDVFSTPETYDELIRRLYTRDEYLTFNLNKYRRSCDIETVKKIVFEPQLKLIAERRNLNAEEIDQVRQDFERELMPEISKNCEKMKLVIEGWFLMEAERIYKPT